jgi:hypothetical protein
MCYKCNFIKIIALLILSFWAVAVEGGGVSVAKLDSNRLPPVECSGDSLEVFLPDLSPLVMNRGATGSLDPITGGCGGIPINC